MKPQENKNGKGLLRDIPSVDKLCRSDIGSRLINQYGRTLFVASAREFLDKLKKDVGGLTQKKIDEILPSLQSMMKSKDSSKICRVFNLTGTVLHTNLGRAVLPEEAIKKVADVMRGATNLEYDLEQGKRGDRDELVESSLVRLTGAEGITVVNNNAAAVFLALSTFGFRKEVLVSRGELVEIGGEFRIPDIMKRAGAKLVEVGTTNRTHLSDFRSAVTKRTGAIMKVHTSNYQIEGFTSAPEEADLSKLAREVGVPFIVDLGSGTLIDLERYGLPREITVSQTLKNGSDIVTFSGDKLLGGPQCGILAGRRGLIKKVKKNSLKRMVRVDKMTLAALHSTLKLYESPDSLLDKLPTLRFLTRPPEDVHRLVKEIEPVMSGELDGIARVQIVECKSQIGSGALPIDLLPSWGVSVVPLIPSDIRLQALNKKFRKLAVPIIGRVSSGRLILDFRCLDEPDLFLEQIRSIGEATA